ncbi:MAG: RNA 2',3'-cyclic phosphodiesterase [Clostridiales bacterium]|nr:RNA 2',3'-cyclic phosphodiesterase [Clostridiales bacterium]
MTPGDARLFIGLELPGEVLAALAGVRRELQNAVSGRLVDPSLYHITLCFLGQTPRRALPHLAALIDRVAFEPLALRLSQIGAFRGGAVIWAGIEEPCPTLHRLQGALADRLREGGFPVERGRYIPHITLGRQVKVVGELPELPPAAFRVGRVTLFESGRPAGKLAYTPLYRSGT